MAPKFIVEKKQKKRKKKERLIFPFTNLYIVSNRFTVVKPSTFITRFTFTKEKYRTCFTIFIRIFMQYISPAILTNINITTKKGKERGHEI